MSNTSAKTSLTSSDRPPPGAPTLCFGDPVVEFVGESPVGSVSDVDAFVPHFGGSAATVAVTACRHGAHVSLAGGAGEDAWGRWLRDRLEREGVLTDWFELVAGARTPVAIVAVDRAGEPSGAVYGERGIGSAVAERLEAAIRASAALFICVGGPEGSDVTISARDLAVSLGRPFMFAPRLCLERWRSRAEAAAVANACVPGAVLVCASLRDAAVMTGEEDAERAALALLKAGARMAVITLGVREGAILRGELRLDVDDVPGSVISSIGAADALTGVLLARLATSAFYPATVAASLPEAMAEAARACERWGALD